MQSRAAGELRHALLLSLSAFRRGLDAGPLRQPYPDSPGVPRGHVLLLMVPGDRCWGSGDVGCPHRVVEAGGEAGANRGARGSHRQLADTEPRRAAPGSAQAQSYQRRAVLAACEHAAWGEKPPSACFCPAPAAFGPFSRGSFSQGSLCLSLGSSWSTNSPPVGEPSRRAGLAGAEQALLWLLGHSFSPCPILSPLVHSSGSV